MSTRCCSGTGRTAQRGRRSAPSSSLVVVNAPSSEVPNESSSPAHPHVTATFDAIDPLLDTTVPASVPSPRAAMSAICGVEPIVRSMRQSSPPSESQLRVRPAARSAASTVARPYGSCVNRYEPSGPVTVVRSISVSPEPGVSDSDTETPVRRGSIDWIDPSPSRSIHIVPASWPATASVGTGVGGR